MGLLYVGHHLYSRLLIPVADLWVEQRNATTEGPSKLSGGNKSMRPIQPAAQRGLTRRSSQLKRQRVFFSKLHFRLKLTVSLAAEQRAAR